MDEPSIPIYYIIDKGSDVSETLQFLSLTPVYCALITSLSDYTIALQYHSDVLVTDSEQSARELAEHINKETGRCSIIIGSTLETHYAEKEIEEVQKP